MNVLHLYMDFAQQMTLNLVAWNGDGSKGVRESCKDIRGKCIIDLSSISDGSLEASFETDLGDKISLFFFEFSNQKIKVVDGLCDLTTLPGDDQQCVCDQGVDNSAACSTLLSKQCHYVKPNRLLAQIDNKVPGFVLQLRDDTFSSDDVTPLQVYAFDDTKQLYYTVGLEKVVKGTTPKPKNVPGSFQAQVRLAALSKDTVRAVKKENFLMANFDSDLMVIFTNAFCKLNTEKGTLITCACCGNEAEKKSSACQTEPVINANTDQYFFSTNVQLPSYGGVLLNGQALSGENKQIQVEFEEEALTEVELEYVMRGIEKTADSSMSTETQVTKGPCTKKDTQVTCSLNVAPVNINNAYIKIKTPGDNYVTAVAIGIKDGQIDLGNDDCKTIPISEEAKNCICTRPTQSEPTCYQPFTPCSSVDSTAQDPKTPIKFQLGVPLANKIELPLKAPRTFYSQDEISNTQAHYLLRLEPAQNETGFLQAFKRYTHAQEPPIKLVTKRLKAQTSQDPIDRVDPDYPTRITMVLLKDGDSKEPTIGKVGGVNFKEPKAGQVILFNNAYCHSVGGSTQILCTCCGGEKKGTGKCVLPSLYKFYFASNDGIEGYAMGSGSVWTKKEDNQLFALWDQAQTYGQPSQISLKYDVQNKVAICAYNENCYIPIVADKNLSVSFSVDQHSRFKTGEIPFNGQEIKDPTKKCQSIGLAPSNPGSPHMCLCPDGKEQNTCQVTQTRKCSLLNVQDGSKPQLKIRFDPSAFQKPTDEKSSKTWCVEKEGIVGKCLMVRIEPVKDIPDDHYIDQNSFLLRLQTSIYQGNGPNLVKQPGSWNFDIVDTDIFVFEQAVCYLENANGKEELKCTCCENSGTAEGTTCTKLTKPTSEYSVQFMITVKDILIGYGQYFGRFKIQLQNDGYFSTQWSTNIGGYNRGGAFFFAERSSTNEEIMCPGYPTSVFKFNTALDGNEQISLSLKLQDKNEAIMDKTKTHFLSFKFQNKKMLMDPDVQQECAVITLPQGRSCVCPEGKEFDPAICGSVAPLPCRSISSSNSNQLDGKSYTHPTFLLTVDSSPQENTNIFVSNGVSLYSFLFRTKKQLDPKNKFTDYFIYLNPTQLTEPPTSTNTQNTIQMNFDLHDTIAVFEDSTCSTNQDKTKWTCQCCLPGQCEKSEDVSGTTTTTIEPPSNSNPNYDPAADPCLNPEDQETQNLCRIKDNGPMTVDNLDDNIEQIKAQNLKNATNSDLNVISRIFEKMAEVGGANTTQRVKIIDLMDRVLTANWTIFEANGQKISDSFLSSMHKVIRESSEDFSYTSGKLVGVQKKTGPCKNEKRWIGMKHDKDGFWDSNDQADSTNQALIQLSLDTMCKDQLEDAKIPAYFIIFKNSKLFNQKTEKDGARSKREANEKKRNRCKKDYRMTNDFVLSSVLLNKTNRVLAEMRFKKEQFRIPEHGNLAVTWWNQAEWSEEKQCIFKEEGAELVAHCNHLTDFALLVETSSTDPILCNFVLDKLGFYLSLFSLIFLFVMLLIFATRLIPTVKDAQIVRIVNNSRRKDGAVIICYVVCMLLFYFLFLVFIDQKLTGSALVCKLTAALLYGLFLCAMLLNIFQAWLMLKTCAWSSMSERVLGSLTRLYVVLPVSLGLPSLITLIIWFADTRFYFRGDQFCWIRPQSVVFAILVPVTLMLLNSFVTFGIFCVRMFPDFFARFGIKRSAVKMASAKRRMNLELFVVILFAQFILGFPWILQYPAMFSSGSTVWHYLFAIFNGSNGIIMFSIYAYGRAQTLYKLHKGQVSLQTASTNVEEETVREDGEVERKKSTGSKSTCSSF